MFLNNADRGRLQINRTYINQRKVPMWGHVLNLLLCKESVSIRGNKSWSLSTADESVRARPARLRSTFPPSLQRVKRDAITESLILRV